MVWYASAWQTFKDCEIGLAVFTLTSIIFWLEYVAFRLMVSMISEVLPMTKPKREAPTTCATIEYSLSELLVAAMSPYPTAVI